MKKIIFIGIVFVVISFFIIEYKTDKKDTNVIKEAKIEEKEYRAIYISYIEYPSILKTNDLDIRKNNIDAMIDNIKESNFNTLIIQVRPFSDAIYNSDIFPSSSTVVDNEGDELGFDILEYIIKKAHKKNLYVFAWINPYRVRNNIDTESISKFNPAYKWLNTNLVKEVENLGIFYNPSEKEVEDLVIGGVEEVARYKPDGILFDDYFYPTDDIDSVNYNEYIKDNPNTSLKQYHLDIINHMVKRSYKSIKKIDKNILFGISPEGNIDNNYDRNYADIKTWLKEDNYIDFIMPQIYYGFNHDKLPFSDTLNTWNDLITNNVSLIPTLALYKSGEEDTFAGTGHREWIENSDIIKKQIDTSKDCSNYGGYAVYRYDYYVNPGKYNNNTIEEVNMLKGDIN